MNDIGHGQLWWADLDGDKIRPVLLLTRSWVAPKLTRVLAAPITTTVRGIPCEVPVGNAEGVSLTSVANLDNTQLIETDRLLARVGVLTPERWKEVCAAMAHVIGCSME
ncbi:MAG: type II toxin-antitoxin system PemK/MazF family toxin [Acidimicrobiales bacterium]